ncbi:DUF2851 family protein [Kaistella jeonii]|uniref:DUF2851 family protein n=1 Tax=Kaistella jeonii TaxID=266749 RepID=A0A0C1D6C8_9FLAO|nr:DUF2851 family protein [Kaistella jeonii]KIA89420.1 hypothetical protein OA86_07505 [Kaistella jeonii]SFC05279.1 Protein of unknown function [Kaistella jeonii]VEI96762.1 Protein of uncharacterised function (DUF2851) [Kaistella jeonii]
MNEKLLQYLWNFKIFKSFDFKDVRGNDLEILDFGKWNFDSGPDFLFGKVKTNNVVLAGNIELHVKSSDYIFHQHSGNPEFENLILHAVFIQDVEVEELNNKGIPTLELKDYIDETLLWKYESLLNENQFIPCSNLFDAKKIPFYFWEETLLKKLDEKSLEIEAALVLNKNNYEAVLFQNLAYSFGLKVNSQIFQQIAESLDFSMVNKIRQNQTQLEALFYGMSNWLENPQEEQTKIWKREFDFLKVKYNINEVRFNPKFSKLRPPNFPTVRLSQFASLYHLNQNLFSKLISARNIGEIYKIFENVKASEYWNNRFNFGKISPVEGEKLLTKDFVDLILINAILPVKYTYHKNSEENIADEILNFYRNNSPEKNIIIEGWKDLKVKVENALETQALLYHHKNFCEKKKCLDCGIGFQLLRNR